MQIRIDRDLPVPVPLQLHGQIEYGVTNGDFPPGSRLPSVRELAAVLGVSPVTVSAVYGRLRASGLIDSEPGRGTFVRRAEPHGLGPLVDPVDGALRRALQRADRAGVGRAELHRAAAADGGAGSPAWRCARPSSACTRPSRARTSRTSGGTWRRATSWSPPPSANCRRRRRPARGPRPPLHLRPSRGRSGTRGARRRHRRQRGAHPVRAHARRAGRDRPAGPGGARQRRAGVRRHLSARHRALREPRRVGAHRGPWHARGRRHGRGGRRRRLRHGAEDVLDGLPADVRAFEYRHVPDPVQVETVLLPLVERLRAAKARGEPPRGDR